MNFSLTIKPVGGYAFNVAQNHVKIADAAPERSSGIFMPVIYGGSARNSLRVITPRFYLGVLSSRRLSGLKSSLVGVLKRFKIGAFKMNVMLNQAEFTPAQSVKSYSEMTVAELFREQKRLFKLAKKEPNNDLSDKILDLGCDLYDLIASTPATTKEDVRAKVLFMLDYYVSYMGNEVMPVDRCFFSAVKTTLEFLKGV